MKKIEIFALALAALVSAAGQAAALEIVSAAKTKTEKAAKADFVLSGPMTVKNIAFEKSAVVMPVTEYKDRTYTDIKLLSKSFYGKLEACFSKDKCSSAVKAAAPAIAVLEVKQLKSPTRVANVILSFDKDLSVTFGLIKKASGETFAAYPANFEVNDEAFKSLIEKKVLEGYESSQRSGKKAAGTADVKK